MHMKHILWNRGEKRAAEKIEHKNKTLQELWRWYFKRRNNKMSFIVYIVIGYYYSSEDDICRCIRSQRILMFYSFYCLHLCSRLHCYLFCLGSCLRCRFQSLSSHSLSLSLPILLFHRIDNNLSSHAMFLLLISFSSNNWQVFISMQLSSLAISLS